MRVLYVATADARGHLMRAQLLAHALRERGVHVTVITTSEEGRRFLAAFDIDASVLSRHYAVQFDRQQNMLRHATDANVAAYVFFPSRMLRDILSLRRRAREADVIINDSFHPALLFMGSLPPWRHKVVHVYGGSLRQALETNFQDRLPSALARLFRRIVAFQIDRSRARLEHDFAYMHPVHCHNQTYRLPTPVAVARSNTRSGARSSVGSRQAAVYLNPHFRDPALAEALERGLDAAGVHAHLVGEGYAGRQGWQAHDQRWIDAAAGSDIIVSAPGMAALSIALVYQKPVLLVLTAQPEQQINAARAAALGLPLQTVVWRDHPDAFVEALKTACAQLLARAPVEHAEEGRLRAIARVQAWVSVLAAIGGAE